MRVLGAAHVLNSQQSTVLIEFTPPPCDEHGFEHPASLRARETVTTWGEKRVEYETARCKTTARICNRAPL